MKRFMSMLILISIITSLLYPTNIIFAEAKINDWPLMEKAINLENQKNYDQALYYWEELVKLYEPYNTIYAYENGGHYARKAGDYYSGEYNPSIFNPEKATYYYEKAYASYLKFSELSGSTKNNWAFVSVKKKLDDIKTELILYAKKELSSASPLDRPLAKYEPVSGLYLGIYGEGNRSLLNEYYVDPNLVKSTYGKNHASLLYYNNYGITPFASDAAKRMKDLGGSLQIHMQPNNLDEVVDGEYLREFARNAKASGIPIFLRFGGEMNGNWVPWGLQPEKYIEKFRLVHDIMEAEAPNVAMVWAPNFFPWDNMNEFYPGDEFVDWVGVSCYTTLSYTFENKETKLKSNPIDLLSYIVEDYGKRKPIMIVEGAVSYYSSLEPSIDYTNWAINNIRRFYSYIPLVYPEIKAIFYYDSMGVAGEKESYILSNNSLLKNVYNEIIQKDYYLSRMDSCVSYKYEKVNTDLEKGNVSFSTYVKSYDPVISKVEYYINDSLEFTSNTLPFDFNYDFSKETSNKVKITVKAYASNGNLVASKDYQLNLKPQPIKVYYQNTPIIFDQPPVIVEGRTLVPMRKLFETFGMSVDYINDTKEIIAHNDDHEIILKIGSNIALVNGKKMMLDVPASLISDRTMVPLRFVGQSIGLDVEYIYETRTIYIE